MMGVLFIGPQASGKSSFFMQAFYKTHLRLNMDMLKTRHRENILLSACLESKQPVVIDNTNPTQQVRAKYIDAFKSYRFEVIGYIFIAGIDECMHRNALRQGKERIPEVGIKATFAQLQEPTFEEGFDKLFKVSLNNHGFTVKECKNEV